MERVGRKKWGILIASLVVGLTLGALEGGLRLTETPRPWEADPTLGWRTRPDFHHRYTHATAGGDIYQVDYATDAQGARRYQTGNGPPLSVLALGDSFTMDSFADDADSWYGHLARGLAGSLGRTIDISAVGASGYGTLQQLLAGRAVVDERSFDLLILQTCINDFVDNSMEWSRRLGWRTGYYQRPFATKSTPLEITWVEGILGSFYRTVGAHSHLWRKADQAMDTLTAWLTRDDETALEQHLNTLLRDQPDLHGETLALTTALVSQVRALAPGRPAFLFNCWEKNPILLNNDWPAIAREAGLTAIPGTAEAVAAAEKRGEDVRVADGMHWSPKGHAIVGELILKRVLSALTQGSGYN